ncbi:hypothetical protein B0H13DRAFT_1711738 [Mycena leptocephala]|nr:hypothetical protein B0H13DRAFT_1711738 [Mycena leptocephala]
MSTDPQDCPFPPGCAEKDPQKPTIGVKSSEPRYVFYRVYYADGTVPTKNGYGGFPFISRIKATSVPPPHTVASLKRALIQAEDLPDPSGDRTRLYQTKDSGTSMPPGAPVAILTGDIGVTPQTAMAIVVEALSKKGTHSLSQQESLPGHYATNKYLYYRLYTRGGEDRSICSFETEPSLGRVERETISPPRDVHSVQLRIAKLERKPIYAYSELFTTMTDKNAQPSTAILGYSAGATEAEPVLLVHPERRAGLHNRPLWVHSVPTYGLGTADYRWLSPSAGDVVWTDGIEIRPTPENGYMNAYMARDPAGKMGCAWADPRYTKLIDEPEPEELATSSCIVQ